MDNFRKKMLDMGKSGYCTQATVELTKRCNASCKYCYIKENEPDELSTKQIYYVLDKLADSGTLFLTFTGGEPFIRDDIEKILNYCIKKEFWGVSFLSNATIISDRLIDLLVQNKEIFTSLQTSVFSHIDKIHDEITNISGSLHKTLKTCHKLKDGGIHISTSINILESNIASLYKTEQYLIKQGFAIQWGLNKIIKKDTKAIDMLLNMTSPAFYKKILNTESSICRGVYRHFHEVQLNQPTIDLDTYPCQGIQMSVYITSGGIILPCIAFEDYPIGSIFENRPLYEIIFTSNKMQKIRAIRLRDLKECSSCEHLAFCNICLGESLRETGDYTKPIPQLCTLAMALKNYGK